MNSKELREMRKIITLTFLKIGIRCDLAGFGYLCYAVELVILNPNLSHNLCKKLYVLISKKFDVEKDHCVERCIRHAIDNTYTNRSFSELNKMFDFKLYGINDKPTAGELILLVAEYYNLKLYPEY